MIVDFHSHILPGIDDGSDSLSCSISMLEQEAQQGIRCVVATPHFYALHDRPEAFLQRRAEAEAALREEMEKHTGLPRLIMGAEVYYFRGISESELLPELTLEGADAILLELPPSPWPEEVYRELERLTQRRGIRPVIAHIDRYIRPFRTYDIPRRLAELDVYVQANAEFFLHRRTATMAMSLLREDRIHLLGSDCHNLSTRKPNLDLAVEKIRKKLGAPALERIEKHQQELLPE